MSGRNVLDSIDDVLADWDGSADSMRWQPQSKQFEHLTPIARLVAEYTGATFDDALDAVADVDEYGADGRGWALCFTAMRTALAAYVDPVLAKLPSEAHEDALRKMTPSMLSAFKQMAVRPEA